MCKTTRRTKYRRRTPKSMDTRVGSDIGNRRRLRDNELGIMARLEVAALAHHNRSTKK